MSKRTKEPVSTENEKEHWELDSNEPRCKNCGKPMSESACGYQRVGDEPKVSCCVPVNG